jgi:hypothetical protein
MSEQERDFGAGGGNTIGRGADDVGGIGDEPGAVPEGAGDGERSGDESAGTQSGAPGDLARPLASDRDGE